MSAAGLPVAPPTRITVVILNWQRRANLVDHILPALQNMESVSEIILGSYDGADPIDPSGKVTVVGASRDMGLDSRFALALLARTPLVLIQDDDLLLPETTIAALTRAAIESPRSIHGLFGRRPWRDNIYAEDVVQTNAEVDIILTRALLTWRQNFALFFAAREFPEIAKARSRFVAYATHPENGEDIILNYAVRAYHGELHQVHHLPAKELPRYDVGVSKNLRAHKGFRTEIMRACQQFMEAP